MYYVFHASLFAKIRKRFIANTPACIDIDFSFFDKKSVILCKKTQKISKWDILSIFRKIRYNNSIQI